MHTDCIKNRHPSPEMAADVTEAKMKHLLHFRQRSCLPHFCCPQRPQHRALHLRGVQNYLLNEKVNKEASRGGRETQMDCLVMPRLHPKGVYTLGFQMLLETMLEGRVNTNVNLTKWYESDLENLIFKNLRKNVKKKNKEGELTFLK